MYMTELVFDRRLKPFQRNRMIADALWTVHGVLKEGKGIIAVDFPTMKKLNEGPKTLGYKMRFWSNDNAVLDALGEDIYDKLIQYTQEDTPYFRMGYGDEIRAFERNAITRWVSVQRIREKRPPKHGVTPMFKRQAYERTVYLDSLPTIGMRSKSTGRAFTLFVDRVSTLPQADIQTFLQGPLNAYGLSTMHNPVYVPDI